MSDNSYEALTSGRKSGVSEFVEVRVCADRRRRWSVAEKLSIVRETLTAGAIAKVVAERHGISTGLLFTWRKQMLAAAMRGMVPVAEGGPDQTPVLTGPELPAPEGAGRPTAAEALIEVELPSGARVRIGAGADAGLVRDVLAMLAGR